MTFRPAVDTVVQPFQTTNNTPVHTYRVKTLHSVVVHLRACSVGVTLLQGVILDVQHGADAQTLVKLWATVIPKHKGHCPALVSHFKVSLEYGNGGGEKQAGRRSVRTYGREILITSHYCGSKFKLTW